jgi:hypothetical protein
MNDPEAFQVSTVLIRESIGVVCIWLCVYGCVYMVVCIWLCVYGCVYMVVCIWLVCVFPTKY